MTNHCHARSLRFNFEVRVRFLVVLCVVFIKMVFPLLLFSLSHRWLSLATVLSVRGYC